MLADLGRSPAGAHRSQLVAAAGRLSRFHRLPETAEIAAWSAMLRQVQFLPAESARCLADFASHEAVRLHQSCAQAKEREWGNWVDKHSCGGMSALYKFSSLPTPFQPANLCRSTLRPCTSLESIDALEAEWKRWWQVGVEHEPLRWPELGDPPPRPTVAELVRALKSFKLTSGTGFDQISPRSLLLLPPAALEALCDIVHHIEHRREWPCMWSRIVFILKRAGGVRPLGLLHVLARVQCRLRRPLIRKWQTDNYRS